MFETLRNALKVKDIRKKASLYAFHFDHNKAGQSVADSGN